MNKEIKLGKKWKLLVHQREQWGFEKFKSILVIHLERVNEWCKRILFLRVPK